MDNIGDRGHSIPHVRVVYGLWNSSADEMKNTIFYFKSITYDFFVAPHEDKKKIQKNWIHFVDIVKQKNLATTSIKRLYLWLINQQQCILRLRW